MSYSIIALLIAVLVALPAMVLLPIRLYGRLRPKPQHARLWRHRPVTALHEQDKRFLAGASA